MTRTYVHLGNCSRCVKLRDEKGDLTHFLRRVLDRGGPAAVLTEGQRTELVYLRARVARQRDQECTCGLGD